jgi:hypothetical protein
LTGHRPGPAGTDLAHVDQVFALAFAEIKSCNSGRVFDKPDDRELSLLDGFDFMIWIGVLFRLMDGNSPLLIAAAVIGASIASAGLLNRFVEQPANRFGRMLSSHMRCPLLAPVTVRLPAK